MVTPVVEVEPMYISSNNAGLILRWMRDEVGRADADADAAGGRSAEAANEVLSLSRHLRGIFLGLLIGLGACAVAFAAEMAKKKRKAHATSQALGGLY